MIPIHYLEEKALTTTKFSIRIDEISNHPLQQPVMIMYPFYPKNVIQNKDKVPCGVDKMLYIANFVRLTFTFFQPAMQ